MNEPIGELLFQNKKPLIRMWKVQTGERLRAFAKHSHTRFEITVVTDGFGEYTTENAVYEMRPGDVFVFSSNEVHCITKIGKEGLSITNLHIEPRYLSEKEPNYSFIDFCFSHSPDFNNRIKATDAAFIRQNFFAIKAEFEQKGDAYETAISSFLNLILIDLLRNHRYKNENLVEKKSSIYSILSVYDYIDAHLCEELTLKELSNVAMLSPNYFSHLFKQLNDISLWDYINAKRIEKAAKLIISNSDNYTMLEIATECGFNNTANFNKTFKKQKGITPSDLKKNPKLLSN